MMERLLKNNNVVKIFAFFLALMLWAYVTGDATRPDVTLSFRNVPLEYHNLDEGMALMSIATEVDVELRGRSDTLEGITPQNLKAYIELQGLEEGTHRLTPNADVPRGVRIISFNPQQVMVELEEVESPQVPVTLEIIGSPADGFVMGEPRLLPNSVFMRGARSLLANVDKIKVVVNIEGANNDRVQMVPIQAVDAAGQPVAGLVVNPAMVEVLIPFSEPQKEVPVRVPLEGVPAQGYRIRQININPATVTIQGQQDMIETIRELLTPSVSMAGATANVTVELPLVNPAKIEILYSGIVRIEIVVEKE